jgi:flavodoxin
MPDIKSRLKIADQLVSDDHSTLTFKFYHADQFDAEGKQKVRTTISLPINELPSDFMRHCACVGFGTIASGRYRRDDDTAPEDTVNALYASMLDGTWTPGRESAPREPSPFIEALAELTKTPTHVIEADMENKTKWTRSYTATVRNDPRVAKKVAEIIEARAKRDAKAAVERSKGQPPALNLGALFSEGERNAA